MHYEQNAYPGIHSPPSYVALNSDARTAWVSFVLVKNSLELQEILTTSATTCTPRRQRGSLHAKYLSKQIPNTKINK